MRLGKFAKMLGPIAAMVAAGGLGGCTSSISFGDDDGVPLAELDTSGNAPTEIVLAGPDRVSLSEGDTLVIEPSGDAEEVAKLRFVLEDGKLAIHRDNATSVATPVSIAVTMPAPEKITIAGSGSVTTGRVAKEAEVKIAGSGKAHLQGIDSDELEIAIAGSGQIEAEGTARELELKIAGSGSGKMAGLKVENADVDIVGSGNATFASDGTVKAKAVGSGDVTVRGSAKCTIKAVGSGSLTCKPGAATKAAEAPAAPEAPQAGE
ncbi:head GIN domain-containing protein [Pseudoblastomonas halimionae]|uniref:DUF2807 domain-containing protein n=1 Tax=Alteriqipengyuania halimionae TaxID=1926630 RepID=A0A6I4U8P9_9SPHN|nr:head GIN domain-containing protein [Alteriqipengyuania halimionae]MXP10862.1 DUF2807 domain-containing protein [Alteriqipengyuania halimionae]